METCGCLQIFKLTTKFVSFALQPKHMNTHSKCYCIPFATSYTGCLRFTTNQLLIPHTHTHKRHLGTKSLHFAVYFDLAAVERSVGSSPLVFVLSLAAVPFALVLCLGLCRLCLLVVSNSHRY